MKKFFFLIVVSLVTSWAKAQVRRDINVEEPTLKGHIKQIKEYTYINPRNIDSLKNPLKAVEDFDEKGYQLDEIIYGKNGSLKSKTTFDNSNPNAVIESIYDDNGRLSQKTISKYDDAGREIEISTFSDPQTSSGSVFGQFKSVYKYDDQNNMIEMDIYTGNTLSSKEIYTYNINHQLIEKDVTEYLPDRTSNQKIYFEYDPVGNKVTDKSYAPDGKLKARHILVFSDLDGEGNWLTGTIETEVYVAGRLNQSLKEVTKRKITYFK